MTEKLLDKYSVDSRERLFVETPQGERYFAIDFNNGQMVVITRTLLYDRAKRRNFEPSAVPIRIPSGRPHIDRGRLPGRSI